MGGSQGRVARQLLQTCFVSGSRSLQIEARKTLKVQSSVSLLELFKMSGLVFGMCLFGALAAPVLAAFSDDCSYFPQFYSNVANRTQVLSKSVATGSLAPLHPNCSNPHCKQRFESLFVNFKAYQNGLISATLPILELVEEVRVLTETLLSAVNNGNFILVCERARSELFREAALFRPASLKLNLLPGREHVHASCWIVRKAERISRRTDF